MILKYSVSGASQCNLRRRYNDINGYYLLLFFFYHAGKTETCFTTANYETMTLAVKSVKLYQQPHIIIIVFILKENIHFPSMFEFHSTNKWVTIMLQKDYAPKFVFVIIRLCMRRRYNHLAH